MRAMSHPVADVVFGAGESAAFCVCGWHDVTATPEALNDAYQDHRVDVGAPRRGSTELTGVYDNRITINGRPVL